MHEAPPQRSAQLVTPAGLVDADTATTADVIVWGDVAQQAFLLSQGTSIQRPRRHHTAA